MIKPRIYRAVRPDIMANLQKLEAEGQLPDMFDQLCLDLLEEREALAQRIRELPEPDVDDSYDELQMGKLIGFKSCKMSILAILEESDD